jgi:hypothetical protein
MSQFAEINTMTHEARLNKIKTLSKKGYLDDGPVALYHALHQLKANGFHATLEFALVELEKLYGLNETQNEFPT